MCSLGSAPPLPGWEPQLATTCSGQPGVGGARLPRSQVRIPHPVENPHPRSDQWAAPGIGAVSQPQVNAKFWVGILALPPVSNDPEQVPGFSWRGAAPQSQFLWLEGCSEDIGLSYMENSRETKSHRHRPRRNEESNTQLTKASSTSGAPQAASCSVNNICPLRI